MQNDAGEFVDLYCPRKCSASNRLIHAKDHASVQLVIADVDPATGRATDSSKMYVICGAIRRMGESDDCIVRLTKKDGILIKYVQPPGQRGGRHDDFRLQARALTTYRTGVGW
ncbi:Ribosomal protein S21 [Danaus plexippus plexippus]|uniref:Small ribosomal subunit protein eS21 n=1 Tax=Danaus plexippus plexippus TaxID=278856 RepID=A0A212EX61_DANPL|nr:Ribosomal protein S21 [Danaus plexippus plexippus]